MISVYKFFLVMTNSSISMCKQIYIYIYIYFGISLTTENQIFESEIIVMEIGNNQLKKKKKKN